MPTDIQCALASIRYAHCALASIRYAHCATAHPVFMEFLNEIIENNK